MLRVLLKVDKVNIRIRQAVELHIVIRKGSTFITHCKREPLINGQLSLKASTQFFVWEESPSFDLEIYLVMGAVKKQGGVVPVALQDFPMGASNRVTAVIQKTPLPNSTMDIDFVFMYSELEFKGTEMVSLQQIQSTSHKANINQMTQQNDNLQRERQRLEEELRGLRTKNEEMESESKMEEESNQQIYQKYSQQLQFLQAQKNSTWQTLESEKQKIAQIMDLINSTGNYALIKRACSILNPDQEQKG